MFNVVWCLSPRMTASGFSVSNLAPTRTFERAYGYYVRYGMSMYTPGTALVLRNSPAVGPRGVGYSKLRAQRELNLAGMRRGRGDLAGGRQALAGGVE